MADERWLSDEEQQAWRAYIAMKQRLERHLERHLQREYGLSGSDFEILANLSEAPDGRMRAFELGEATQWEKSRLSHHLTRMEKRGLLRRESGGGRYPEIRVTEAGRQAVEAAAPGHVAVVRELFIDPLGADRLALVRQVSDDVLAAIAEHQGGESLSEVPC